MNLQSPVQPLHKNLGEISWCNLNTLYTLKNHNHMQYPDSQNYEQISCVHLGIISWFLCKAISAFRTRSEGRCIGQTHLSYLDFYARESTTNSLGFRVYPPDATSVFMQGKAPLTV